MNVFRNTYDKPVNPVTGALWRSSRNHDPIVRVEFLSRLDPVTRVSDEVGIIHGDDGLPSRASETVRT